MATTTTIPFPTPARATLAAAALALLASAAQAQSSVQAYGLIDLNAGSFQNAGGTKIKRVNSGDLSTSYLGFKGREDLGGGLSASFALDGFFLGDSGGAGRVPGVDAFWARNANVSLSGGFGTLKLGRQGPPLFVSTLIFNSLGDSFGWSPSIRQYYSAPYGTPLVGDSGWNNAVGYTTPAFAGATATVLVAAGEGAATAKGPNIGANVVYFGGPLGFTVAAQKVQAQGVLGRGIAAFPGFDSQTAFQVGASYNLGFAKLFAQYGKISTDATADVDSTILNLSASIPVGAGSFRLAYGSSKITTQGASTKPKSTILTAGYVHGLSKRTELYGMFMQDKFTGLSSGTSVAGGIRHTF
ncbi:MAG: porin [Rubrivivax sp.]|nr:porin [Rubrivivax sp.]